MVSTTFLDNATIADRSFLALLEEHGLSGGAGPGYAVWADAVNRKHKDTFKTTDSVPLSAVIDEFLDTLTIYNNKQKRLVSLLSYPTTDFWLFRKWSAGSGGGYPRWDAVSVS